MAEVPNLNMSQVAAFTGYNLVMERIDKVLKQDQNGLIKRYRVALLGIEATLAVSGTLLTATTNAVVKPLIQVAEFEPWQAFSSLVTHSSLALTALKTMMLMLARIVCAVIFPNDTYREIAATCADHIQGIQTLPSKLATLQIRLDEARQVPTDAISNADHKRALEELGATYIRQIQGLQLKVQELESVVRQLQTQAQRAEFDRSILVDDIHTQFTSLKAILERLSNNQFALTYLNNIGIAYNSVTRQLHELTATLNNATQLQEEYGRLRDRAHQLEETIAVMLVDTGLAQACQVLTHPAGLVRAAAFIQMATSEKDKIEVGGAMTSLTWERVLANIEGYVGAYSESGRALYESLIKEHAKSITEKKLAPVPTGIAGNENWAQGPNYVVHLNAVVLGGPEETKLAVYVLNQGDFETTTTPKLLFPIIAETPAFEAATLAIYNQYPMQFVYLPMTTKFASEPTTLQNWDSNERLNTDLNWVETKSGTLEFLNEEEARKCLPLEIDGARLVFITIQTLEEEKKSHNLFLHEQAALQALQTAAAKPKPELREPTTREETTTRSIGVRNNNGDISSDVSQDSEDPGSLDSSTRKVSASLITHSPEQQPQADDE